MSQNESRWGEQLEILRQIRDELVGAVGRLFPPPMLAPPPLQMAEITVPLSERIPSYYKGLAKKKELGETRERIRTTAQKFADTIRDAAGKVFDALTAGARGTKAFLKGFALPQLRTLFQNISVELTGILGRWLPQIRGGLFGRLLKGTIFNVNPLQEAARQHQVAAGALTGAAGALVGAANALGAAAASMGASGIGDEEGSMFLNQAFGGKLTGMLRGLGGLPALLRSLLGGKAGAVAGAGVAGAIFGAKGAGFGIAGLGKLGGALLGGAITAGLAAALLFGVPKLFGGGKTPAERSAEIDRIIEANRFVSPEPIEREVGFSAAGAGEFDFSSGGERRLIPPMQVTVQVSAMDSRSFLDRAPEIAHAVRKAMLDMHPLNQLVRESF